MTSPAKPHKKTTLPILNKPPSDDDDDLPLSRLIARPSSSSNSISDSLSSNSISLRDPPPSAPPTKLLSPVPSSSNPALHACIAQPIPTFEQPSEATGLLTLPGPTTLLTYGSTTLPDPPVPTELKLITATPPAPERIADPNQPSITKFVAPIKHASPKSVDATISAVLSECNDSLFETPQPAHPTAEEMRILSTLETDMGLVEVQEEPMPSLPIVLSSESSTSAASSDQTHAAVSPVASVVESPTPHPPPPPPTPPKPVNRLRILPFPLKRDMRLAPTNRRPDLFAATSASSSKVSTEGGTPGAGAGAVEKPAAGKGIAAWRALGFQIGKKSALPGASADTSANTSKFSASGGVLGTSNPKDASTLPEPLARMRAMLDQHLENQVRANHF